MNHYLRQLIILLTILMAGHVMAAQDTISFGIIAGNYTDKGNEAAVVQALSQANAAPLSFVVMQGIKHQAEPCSDELYQQRKTLLDSALHPLFLTLAASDWTACVNSQKKPIPTERLQRLREIFYTDPESLGKKHMPLQQQSMIARFRTFPENLRWEQSGILFATLNVPSPNNFWQQGGGRKSEFEDRMVANIDWLQRLLKLAETKKLPGIVIFTDADMSDMYKDGRDGLRELRNTLLQHATHFKGKILLVSRHSGNAKPGNIHWNQHIGVLVVSKDWVRVEAGISPDVFRLLHTADKQVMPGQEFFLD